MQNGLSDECLNASWFRTLNVVGNTLANWRREYNWERPHSSLGYRTPEEFRQRTGYANVEGTEPSHIYTATTAATGYFQSQT